MSDFIQQELRVYIIDYLMQLNCIMVSMNKHYQHGISCNISRECDTQNKNCENIINTQLKSLELVNKKKQSVSFSSDLVCVKYFDTRQPSRCLYEYDDSMSMRGLHLMNFTFGPVIHSLYAYSFFFRGAISIHDHLFIERSSIFLRYTLDMRKSWIEHTIIASLPETRRIIDFFIPWNLSLVPYNTQLEFMMIVKSPNQQYFIDNHGENFILFITEMDRIVYTSDSESENLTNIKGRNPEE